MQPTTDSALGFKGPRTKQIETPATEALDPDTSQLPDTDISRVAGSIIYLTSSTAALIPRLTSGAKDRHQTGKSHF